MKKVRFLIDWRDRKKGEVRNYGDRDADELVKLGYVEITRPESENISYDPYTNMNRKYKALDRAWRIVSGYDSLSNDEKEIFTKKLYEIEGNKVDLNLLQQFIDENFSDKDRKLINQNASEYLNKDLNEIIAENKKKFADAMAMKNIKVDNYLQNVLLFQQEQPFIYDKNCLFWFWNKNEFFWEMVDETDLMNTIDKTLSLDGMTVSSRMKANYMEAFRRVGREFKVKSPEKTWIQFKDKIIDVKTGNEFVATSEYFIVNPISREINLTNSETPTIDRIFTEWVGSDHVTTLKEIFAFCLLCDYPLARIFCFVGPGANGKSCALRMLEKFVGLKNVCSTDLSILIKNHFESAKLYHKLVAFMGETDFNELRNSSTLKRVVGEDLMRIEFKNKNPFDAYLYAKLIISTNTLPTTADKTDGFYRRWLIIDFPNKFSEKKDILSEIPEEEYDALALQSIALLGNILSKREFTNEGSIEDRKNRYEEKSDPLTKFIKENCIEEPNAHVFKYEFSKNFTAWLLSNNYRVWNETEIGRKMREHYETQRVSKDFFENGKWITKYINAWVGLKLLGVSEQ